MLRTAGEALSQVGFDGIQFTEYIGKMNRVQIPKTMSIVFFENRVNHCRTQLGADCSRAVFNVDNPVFLFRFCHCLSLLVASASQSRKAAEIFVHLSCTGIFMINELQDGAVAFATQSVFLWVTVCFHLGVLIFSQICVIIKYQGYLSRFPRALRTSLKPPRQHFPPASYMVHGQFFG